MCRSSVAAPSGTISEKSSSFGARVTRGIVTEGAALQLWGAPTVSAMASTQCAVSQHLGIIGIFIYRRGAVTSGHFLGRGKRRTVTVEMNGTKIGSGVFTCIPCVVPGLSLRALNSALAWYNELILNQPLSHL